MPVTVLLIQTRPERVRELAAALTAEGFAVLGVIGEQDDIHETVRRLKPDAILIDADSPSRDTLEGLALVGDRFPRPILMLSGTAHSDLVREMAALGVSTYAVDGLSAPLLRTLVEVTIAQFQRQQQLNTRLSAAQRELAERRHIERAKCTLMEVHGISEDEAYHRLRRAAMSRGLRLADYAAELSRSAAGGTG